jgi:hypothetical protein
LTPIRRSGNGRFTQPRHPDASRRRTAFHEHVFSIAEFDVMNNGVAPEQAIDKAFKRAEAIFAKYQIVQG